jgi:sugar diacid utilization regulator
MSGVTLGRLLAMGLLSGHEVLGGAGGLDRRVRMVVPGTTVAGIEELAPGSVVVFGPDQLVLDDLSADLALRLAHSAGLAGILAELPGRPVPLVTRRLADKLRLPLVGLPAVSPATVAATFDPYVRAPEIAGLRLLGTTAQRFQTAPASPRQLTSTLAATLGGPVALVDAEGRLVSGDAEAHVPLSRPEIRAHLDRSRPVPGTFELETGPPTDPSGARTEGPDTALVAPVQLDRDGPAAFWLAARLSALPAALLEPVRQSLGVAALSFAVYVAGHTATLERESRRRSLLLGEILDQVGEAGGPAPRTVERAAALGWRLAGWHTAVHLAVKESAATVRPGELAGEVEDRLASSGLRVRLVERVDGWAFWTTSESEAAAAEPGELRTILRDALHDVEADHRGLVLCAGVGGGHPGTAGIARSLDEARQACLLARTESGASGANRVEHIDAVSMKRLLVGWYASGTLRSVADEIVTPLITADPSGELVRTLRLYLDLESSTTLTAARLGVHRNTVMQRIDRARRLLSVDLDDPDDRIVVHLATRAVGIDWDRR